MLSGKAPEPCHLGAGGSGLAVYHRGAESQQPCALSKLSVALTWKILVLSG